VSWTPIDEGTYVVVVTAREPPPSTAATASLASLSFRVTSPAVSGPVVASTVHPLVALYSEPPCGVATVRVWFSAGPDPRAGQVTPAAPCYADRGTNLYLVGLYASTTYAVQSELTNGTTQ